MCSKVGIFRVNTKKCKIFCKFFEKIFGNTIFLCNFATTNNNPLIPKIMTTYDFCSMIETQKFVDFEFKLKALCEVENGKFFFFKGTFFQANGCADRELRICENLRGETKIIPNAWLVSAVMNY